MGFTPACLRGVDEVDCAKNVAVVGHGHGGHAQLFHTLAEFFDVTGAVEHGVVGVQVQVDELGHGVCVISLPQEGQRKEVVSVGFRGGLECGRQFALWRFTPTG